MREYQKTVTAKTSVYSAESCSIGFFQVSHFYIHSSAASADIPDTRLGLRVGKRLRKQPVRSVASFTSLSVRGCTRQLRRVPRLALDLDLE